MDWDDYYGYYDDYDDDDWNWDDYDDYDDDDDDDDYKPTTYVTNDGITVTVVGEGSYQVWLNTGAYVTNDGITVTVVGEGSYQVWLNTGAYGSAQHINANPSWGSNVLVGNYAPNLIVAGAGQTNLWGGQDYANDMLVGGTGYDTFLCGKNEGSDAVSNASAFDNVRLYDVTLNDIAYTVSDGRGTVAFQFRNGNVLSVQGSDYVSAAFVLADGSAYRYNNMTQSWQGA